MPLPSARNAPVSRAVLAIHWFGSASSRGPSVVVLLGGFIYRLADLIIVKLLIGADIPRSCRLGTGVVLGHGAKGVILGDNVSIGDNTTIYHQVTVARHCEIGRGVWIGPGAKILEGTKIGDNAKVGANAVVVSDVPAGATAVGVPARVPVPTEPGAHST